MILQYSPTCKIANPRGNADPGTHIFKEAGVKDQEYKRKAKEVADGYQRRTKVSELKEGDFVLVKEKNGAKVQPAFDPKPFVVVKRKGNQVYLKRNKKYIRRPLDHCKHVPYGPNVNLDDSHDDWLRLGPEEAPTSSTQQNPLPNMHDTVDHHQFQRRVLNPRTSPSPPRSPPPITTTETSSMPQWTSSGRQIKPVIGNRLIDNIQK